VANREFRTNMCNLIGHLIQAGAEGREKQAKEYRRILAERGMYLFEKAETSEARMLANSGLRVCNAEFGDDILTNAARLESWGTKCTVRDKFTIHFLVDSNGRKIGHRIIGGC